MLLHILAEHPICCDESVNHIQMALKTQCTDSKMKRHAHVLEPRCPRNRRVNGAPVGCLRKHSALASHPDEATERARERGENTKSETARYRRDVGTSTRSPASGFLGHEWGSQELGLDQPNKLRAPPRKQARFVRLLRNGAQDWPKMTCQRSGHAHRGELARSSTPCQLSGLSRACPDTLSYAALH